MEGIGPGLLTVDHVEAANHRASNLCKQILRHKKECESELKQRERYNTRPSKYPSEQVIFHVLQEAETLDEIAAARLIKNLAQTDSADLATATADFLIENQPEIGLTSTVLDAALSAAATTCFRPETAQRYYRLRCDTGLPLTLHAANLAITGFSHCGDVSGVLLVLENLKQSGLGPNDFSIVVGLQATNFKRRGRHKDAIRMISYMLALGRPLSSEVIDVLIGVFEAGILKAGSLSQAEEVFEDLRTLGLGDSTRAYNALLQWCAKRGEWQRAHSHFQAMARLDVPADKVTFRSLITACLRGGALDAALDIYEWMVASKDVAEPMPADIDTYNTLMKACHQAGLLEKALEIAAWVQATGVPYNTETYDELIATVEVAQIWDTKVGKGVCSRPFQQGGNTPRTLSSKRELDKDLQRGMVPFCLFPEQLRPAPFDGLRLMYLDHLEELQEEASLAALKLGTGSWAASTLMRGGHGQTGRRTPPVPTTAVVAAAGQGIFTSSSGGAARKGGSAIRLPRILAPHAPVALSRAPSFRDLSLDNVQSPGKRMQHELSSSPRHSDFPPKTPGPGGGASWDPLQSPMRRRSKPDATPLSRVTSQGSGPLTDAMKSSPKNTMTLE